MRRGLYGATVRGIVQEAGLTAPALYYHFESKEAVYAEIIRYGIARLQSLVEEELRLANDTVGRLKAIAVACIRFAEEDRTRLRLFYEELFRPREDADGDIGVQELRGWARSRVEEVLRKGVEDRELPPIDVSRAGRVFGALISGLFVEQARKPKAAVLDVALAGDIVRIFFWGIASEQRAPI